MLLKAQLATLILLTALSTWLGIDKELYLSVWWWDIPNHFLGGVWVALFAAWLFKTQKKKITIGYCVLFVLLIGGAWEIFEYSEDVARSAFMPYWLDTTKDFCVDVVGAICGGLLAQRINKIWRK